jgi:hypothetical protein
MPRDRNASMELPSELSEVLEGGEPYGPDGALFGDEALT